MKNQLRNISFCLLCFFTFRPAAWSQWYGSIDSMRVVPANPGTQDDVEILLFGSFPSGDCEMTDSSLAVAGQDILIEARHCTGMLTVICYATDTFHVGQLGAGNYTVSATMFSGFGIPCDSFIVAAQDTLTFNVTGSNASQSGLEYFTDISVSGTSEEVTVMHNNQNVNFRMYITDLTGKTLTEFEVNENPERIPVNLCPGFYVWRARDENGNSASGKFLITEN